MHKLDFSNINVLVIGDIILDQYRNGLIERISPEAPIPILSKVKSRFVLGGAANVAANVNALGANAFLLSVIGNDDAGKKLKNILERANMNSSLVEDPGRKTTLKTRFISKGKQLLRVDHEDNFMLSQEMRKKIQNQLETYLSIHSIDLIIIQDYDKGVFSKELIDYLVSKAREWNIKICVDPKIRNFDLYKNVDLIKPNKAELVAALGKEFDLDNLDKQLISLNRDMRISNWYITLSELGIYHFDGLEGTHLPTQKVDVVDVCGAGDAVMSIVSLLFYKELDPKEIMVISNALGALACQIPETAVVSKQLLLEKLSEMSYTL